MKVGIAHASASAARALETELTRNDAHQVAWVVSSGRETLAKVAEAKPDLLLLDVCLQDPSSIEVTRRVMKDSPCSILLVADNLQARTELIYEGMGLGALDVVVCPTQQASGQVVGREAFHTKLHTVVRIVGASARRVSVRPRARARSHRLVAIGASTGGPQAVAQILAALPRDLNASLVIVQHVDQEFSSGLASWLQQNTPLRVALATSGVTPMKGTAWLAASNDHLVMTRARTLHYTPEPRETAYRPSVDALFQSLAEHWPDPAIAVLLTGMGRDGARGMKRLREAGWHTIAQNEATSVVFGMPKAAVELGAAAQVLALPDIAAAIVRECGGD